MTIERAKPVSSITVADLRDNPLWQFTNEDEPDEISVRAVRKFPVHSLNGKIVGTQVMLANGNQVWAIIGNVDVMEAAITDQFLTLSIEANGQWFHLARYHDFDYAERGSGALARFLGLHVDEVFPISFDVRRYAQGNPEALCGVVRREPRVRLSRSQIIALSIP